MRAVAARLGAAPMALYNHFATRDALVDALLDRVLHRFAPAPPTDDWREDLRAFARAHRRLLSGHPWAVAPLFSQPNPGLGAVRIGEHALGILERGGYRRARGRRVQRGDRAQLRLVVVHRRAELDPGGGGARGRRHARAAPGALFPRTVAVAEEMGGYGGDEDYEPCSARSWAVSRAPTRMAAMSTPPVETPPRERGAYSEAARQKLIESRLTPNAISLTGFVLCVVAAVLVWQDHLFWGGLAFVVGSVCDTLDGRYSRMSGKGTQFGAFLDSTLDRIEEGVVLAAVAVLFSQDGKDGAVAAVVIAVLASLMVSYTRARAEALGVECKVGIADRAVRVVILSAGLLLTSFGLDVLELAVYVLAGLSVMTVLQRIFHVRSQLVHGAGAV